MEVIMKAYGWFKDEWERARDTFEYKLEGLELEVTEKILEIMEQKDISRSQLAERLGVSKAAISKLFNNGSNMTLKRLLTIAEALEQELRVSLVPHEHKLAQNFVDYKPGAHLQGPQFRLEGVSGADDYSAVEGETTYAINGC
jgi:transcriptional regulator with XRE-family HTH domain